MYESNCIGTTHVILANILSTFSTCITLSTDFLTSVLHARVITITLASLILTPYIFETIFLNNSFCVAMTTTVVPLSIKAILL